MNSHKTLMLLVTYKCNLRCSYCYEPKVNTSHITEKQAKRILSKEIQALSDSCDELEIHFMGGEPLLEFSLLKNLAEWLWSSPFPMPPFRLFAPTNGTLLDEEMKEWLSMHRDRFYLGLSFDGDMNMQNTNRSSSYSRVDLDFFSSTWPEQSVKMTISPQTVDRLCDGIIFLHEKGFKHIRADLAMGESVEWGSKELLLYKQELEKLSDFYLSNPLIEPCSLLTMNILDAGKHWKTPVKGCSCGEDLICIDLTGRHYACHLFSPITIPVAKADESTKNIDFHNHDLFVSECCRKCFLETVCDHCYGMNYICNGDVAMPSPSHCSANKIRFVANCRYLMNKALQENNSTLINEITCMLNKL